LSAIIHPCDCIPGMAYKLPENSIDLTVTSIPFGSLFTYSAKTEDIGNNQDGVELDAGMFGLHMRFFVEQLYRVMKPGCNACIHVQQLLRHINQHGSIGRRNLRDATIRMFERGGFEWKGEFVIPKNPQIIAKRLSLHSLQFMTGHSRNARDLAPAVNDYVILFQKPGESEPVRCLQHYQANPGGWVTQNDWIRDAHGVWKDLNAYYAENFALEGFGEAMDWWVEHIDLETGIWDDIRETDILENFKGAREKGDEKHVCPLQLELIRRCVRLWTNPGETVLDPFMGIGSTGYVAIEQGRKAVGFELKESYHALAVRNCGRAEEKAPQVELSFVAPIANALGIEAVDVVEAMDSVDFVDAVEPPSDEANCNRPEAVSA
jgi:DNA modification methylase